MSASVIFIGVKRANNRIQLTVISVIFFAKAKKPSLITSADEGVIFKSHPLIF
jgi:hypothetical protein